MKYFKGNTRSRRLKMDRIHKKFLSRQRKWMARRLVANRKLWR